MNNHRASLDLIRCSKINSNSVKMFQDYNIKENSSPRKTSYVVIPQKPVEVYDCINNVNRKFQPPSIELENHSPYREHYYKSVNSSEKPFNRSVGYFSHFVESTRSEKEFQDICKISDLLKKSGRKGQNQDQPVISKMQKQQNFRYTSSLIEDNAKPIISTNL